MHLSFIRLGTGAELNKKIFQMSARTPFPCAFRHALEYVWCSVFVHFLGTRIVVERRLDEPHGGQNFNAWDGSLQGGTH